MAAEGRGRRLGRSFGDQPCLPGAAVRLLVRGDLARPRVTSATGGRDAIVAGVASPWMSFLEGRRQQVRPAHDSPTRSCRSVPARAEALGGASRGPWCCGKKRSLLTSRDRGRQGRALSLTGRTAPSAIREKTSSRPAPPPVIPFPETPSGRIDYKRAGCAHARATRATRELRESARAK